MSKERKSRYLICSFTFTCNKLTIGICDSRTKSGILNNFGLLEGWERSLFWMENLKETDHVENITVGGGKILKCIKEI
jgi:hypothetical protein